MFLFILPFLSIFAACSTQLMNKPLYMVWKKTALVPRVVNGYAAALGDVPYQVSFKAIKCRARKLYYNFCGGTIIGSSKIVSAAHCFKTKRSGSCKKSIVIPAKDMAIFFAVAGTLRNVEHYPEGNTTAQWKKIDKVIIPSNYRFPNEDIAVVMTASPFEFNSYVTAISYADSRFREYVGQCLVSGYGRTSNSLGGVFDIVAGLARYTTSFLL